jgi:hypothetical protein
MGCYYYYTDLESPFNCRRVLAMLDGKLPLTNPSRFNDPFDSRLRFKPGFTEAQAIEYLELKPEWLPIWRELKKDPIYAALQKKGEAVFSRWTSFAVSEAQDSLLMWAHYGGQHKGICLKLEYDETKRPEGSLFEKIRYTTHYPQVLRMSLDQDLDEGSLKTLLLTKSIEWHYEREWRLAVQDAPPEVDYEGEDVFDGVINSPFKVIGVCYGFRATDGSHKDFNGLPENEWKYTKIAVVAKIAERIDISLHQNSLSGTEFKLEPINLEE